MNKLLILPWVAWTLIAVECLEAAGSVVLLFLSLYNTIALLLITTHCVLFTLVTKVFVGFTKVFTSLGVSAERSRKASKGAIILYLFIIALAVLFSVMLLFVSMFTGWSHTVSMQACASVAVMSKGHLRKDFLNFGKIPTMTASTGSVTELVSRNNGDVEQSCSSSVQSVRGIEGVVDDESPNALTAEALTGIRSDFVDLPGRIRSCSLPIASMWSNHVVKFCLTPLTVDST